MITKPVRFSLFALLMLMLAAAPTFAQDLFEEEAMKPPLTEEQKAAGERESIFGRTMKVGQVCSHGTAAILGQKDEDAKQWQVWARKYNASMNTATEQLFKDAEAVLTPQQMNLLKAWFALGWNEQINKLFYGKELDDPAKAKLDEVKKMSEKHEQHKK